MPGDVADPRPAINHHGGVRDASSEQLRQAADQIDPSDAHGGLVMVVQHQETKGTGSL